MRRPARRATAARRWRRGRPWGRRLASCRTWRGGACAAQRPADRLAFKLGTGRTPAAGARHRSAAAAHRAACRHSSSGRRR